MALSRRHDAETRAAHGCALGRSSRHDAGLSYDKGFARGIAAVVVLLAAIIAQPLSAQTPPKFTSVERKNCTEKRFNYRLYRKYQYQLKNSARLSGFQTLTIVDQKGAIQHCLAGLEKNILVKPGDIAFQTELNPSGRNPEYVVRTINLMPKFNSDAFSLSGGAGQSVGELAKFTDVYYRIEADYWFSLPAVFRKSDFIYFVPAVSYGEILPSDDDTIVSYIEATATFSAYYFLFSWKGMKLFTGGGAGAVYENILENERRLQGFTPLVQVGAIAEFKVWNNITLGPSFFGRWDIEQKIIATKAEGRLAVRYWL